MVRLKRSTAGVLVGQNSSRRKRRRKARKKESLLRTEVSTYNKRKTSLSLADPNTESSQPQQATVASI